MSGTIEFENVADLAEFLKAFQGSTAIFHVCKVGRSWWRLKFTGGY